MSHRPVSTRNRLRILHLLTGASMAAYVYLPPGSAPWLQWALMLIGVPAVTATGVWLWKQAAIRRLVMARRRPTSTGPGPGRGLLATPGAVKGG